MTLLLTHPTAVVATAIDDRRTDRGWRRVHRLGKGNERRAPRPADVGPASPSSLRRRVRRGADISSRDAPTDISRPVPSLGHVLIRVSPPVSSPALWGARNRLGWTGSSRGVLETGRRWWPRSRTNMLRGLCSGNRKGRRRVGAPLGVRGRSASESGRAGKAPLQLSTGRVVRCDARGSWAHVKVEPVAGCGGWMSDAKEAHRAPARSSCCVETSKRGAFALHSAAQSSRLWRGESELLRPPRIPGTRVIVSRSRPRGRPWPYACAVLGEGE